VTWIKLCGVTRPSDIAAVNEALPDFVGFVFVASSRRQVDAAQAVGLRRLLDRRITAVGVFRDAPVEFVAELVSRRLIDWVQLHGGESSDYLHQLRSQVEVPIIKAVAVTAWADVSTPDTPDPTCPTDSAYPADYLLFDRAGGGSGRSFDHSLIAQARAQGRLPAKPYFIAGGLNLDNLNTALELQPTGVDISSGAETAGRKDPDKILRLVRAVRAGSAAD
jgi:phosphoribosylanthranilate isomerase